VGVPTPPYIVELREHIGHELLLLPAVTAVLVRETEAGPQVLLGRRSDDGQWSLPAGIVEPGEQPAVTLVRETLEETRVVARVDRLVQVSMAEPIVYPNGDRCQFLLHQFRCSYVSGEAGVGDEESTAVDWFFPDELPEELAPRVGECITLGLPLHGDCRFEV
jgi:8-oxo-dGTP pyrophosphatase MutT (NUDIX family)